MCGCRSFRIPWSGESEDKEGISTWRLFDFGRDAPIVNAATSRDRDVLHAVVHVGHGKATGTRIENLLPQNLTIVGIKRTEATSVVTDKNESTASS